MRHKIDHRRLGVNKDQRKALIRSLCINLAEYGQIDTTVARAKETRREFEKLITLGKKGDLHSRRLAYQKIANTKSVRKIFDEYAKEFKDRHGGYTRIFRLNNRLGDNSEIARLVLVGQGEVFNIRTAATKPADKKTTVAESVKKELSDSTSKKKDKATSDKDAKKAELKEKSESISNSKK